MAFHKERLIFVCEQLVNELDFKGARPGQENWNLMLDEKVLCAHLTGSTLTAGINSSTLLRVSQGKVTAKITLPSPATQLLALEDCLLLGHKSGAFSFWSERGGLKTVKGRGSAIRVMCRRQEGLVVVGEQDGTISCYRVSEGEQELEAVWHKQLGDRISNLHEFENSLLVVCESGKISFLDDPASAMASKKKHEVDQ